MSHDAILEAVMKTPMLGSLSKLSGNYFAREEEDSNFIRVSIRKSSDFVPETMRNVVADAENGVTVVMGVVKASKVKVAVSAFRFPITKFDMKKAISWAADHYASKDSD